MKVFSVVRLCAVMFLAAFFSVAYFNNAFATAQGSASSGYNVKCDPGPIVHDNNDGTSTVKATFNLFNGSMKSADLGAGDFVVYDDDQPVVANIVTPSASGKKVADVIFCLDISGSMSDEINAVKNNINKFVDYFKNKHNYDVRLGLITFGQSASPYLRERNSGQFYSSVEDFKNEVATLTANGWREEWFEAVGLASQYSFRPDAARVIILITDEPGDATSDYPNVEKAIQVAKSNGAKVFGISYNNLATVKKVVDETNGELYNIYDSFEDILQKIADSVSNTYTVSFITADPPGIHTMKVEISQNGNYCTANFKIGANPTIALTTITQDAVQNGLSPNTNTFDIEAEIKDDGSISSAEIIITGGNVSQMSPTGADIYTYTATGLNSVGDCVEFSIKAVDDEGRAVTKGPWKICVSNSAPTIGTISPTSYDYGQDVSVSADVSDPDGDAITVTMKYRKKGTMAWQSVAMSQNGSAYEATIPGADAGFDGLDVEIEAVDSNGAVSTGSQSLSVNTIPVSIVSVTRLIDTLDPGPFTIYAVVAGLDVSAGGTVDLSYTINGGSSQTTSMTLTVTGTSASIQSNSNIYVADIPKASAGDEVCYKVVASNPTDTEESQEYCYNILEPVAPLGITPSSVRMCVTDDPIEFIAAGGHGTYSWQSLNGQLSSTLQDKVTYTPQLAGLDKISVQDIKGFTATSVIEVLPALAISPDVDGKRFSPSSTVALTVTGCEPPYTWQVDGAASFKESGNDNEQVTIELGADPATITATATDAGGRKVSVTFTNNGVLSISPSGEATLNLGAEQKFTASGGQEPYSWQVVGGDLDTQSGTEVTYKAPEAAGVYHLTVTDANGDYSSVTIKVGEPLRVTPHSVRIMRGETAQFQVVSGAAPYKWEAEYGRLSSVTGDKVTYTPEDTLGLYVINVYDNAGSVVKVTVEVSEGLVVTPSTATVETGQTQEITVTGGTGSYTWSALRGKVVPITGDKVTYTAPDDLGDGKDEVTVRDDAGNEAKVTISVVESVEKLNELTITPQEVTLTLGASQTFVVHNAKDASLLKWTATSGEITSDGVYTAPEKAGTYTVTATDLANGRQASATVTVKSELTLTPTSASLNTDETKDFHVSGGSTPYLWKIIGEGDLSSDTGETVTYTPSSKTGTVKLIVMDASGVTASAEITVMGAMKISPASVTLAPGMSQTFSVFGGSGTYTWSANKGQIDNSGHYSAPSDIGTDIITVADDAGNEATATVTVGNIPVVTPAKAWLDLGGSREFTVTGGTGPFTWTVSAGDLSSTTGNSVIFTAPDVSQEITVTVTDSLGQKSEATVYVDLPMQATNEEVYIEPDETIEIAVTGGVPPFEWTATKGKVGQVKTDEEGYNTYTAGHVQIDDTITVRDRKGNTIDITVHIIKKLLVSPSVRYMKRESTKTFTVTGGVPPYSAIVLEGDGDIEQSADCDDDSESCVFSFTSGSVSDEDVVIQFTDNAEQEYTVHAYVERKLIIQPAAKSVQRGETFNFNVFGGYGGYIATSSSGADVYVDPETGRGSYTAPRQTGEDIITVLDASDQTVTAKIEIVRGTPMISPTQALMTPGETKTFMVSMGAGSYEWHFEGGLYTCMDEECSVVQVTAPSQEGTYELSVEDGSGQTAKTPASIEVKLPLMITPASFVVYKGESSRLRVSAVGGAPPYDFVVKDVTEVTRGDDYIVVNPNTQVEVGTEYEVLCRDSSDEIATMKIVVSRLPGDINGDGMLDDSEMELVIRSYLEGGAVGGITVDDPTLVYKHAEVYAH